MKKKMILSRQRA